MKKENKTEKLEIVFNSKKLSYCPDDPTTCPHLDKSIKIIREKTTKFACSSPENQDNNKDKVLSIQVCPSIKVVNCEDTDNKSLCRENQSTCGKFHIINTYSQNGKILIPICFTSNPPNNSVKMCTNIQMYLDFGNSPKTDNQT